MKLSIIIPVFNEENTISQVLEKVNRLNVNNIEKQVIVVNDGSTDETRNKIEDIIRKKPEIKIISHSKNQGKGAAVRTGIKNATGTYVIIQDADLEYDPKYIQNLIVPIQKEKTEVVYGTRLNRLPHLFNEEKGLRFLIHYFGNRFLSLLTSVLYGQWITDMETGYKIFPKEAVVKMNLSAKSFDFEPEITAKLLKRGYKILEFPIKTIPRGYKEGKKLNTIKDGIIAFWTLLKYRFVD